MVLIVYIKKIAMKGFKSYGNRKISVPFHKGFTCVVGPNGSGKSNIFDAISFVLGRMSAKSMRAGSISDLVFAGTNKQKPAQYTEVSMFFDNNDRVLPLEKDEVVISRKVDKSGKSVYRVNNKRETRTYVLDLLNLVGLTPDGYNMIAQGDIARFVKMSSFDRRTIIEEISGIQEYDEKKEKGLRELGKAEENIARVELVVNEVRSQMNRLENEKNDALRYQYLKDEISKNKGAMIYGELDDSNAQLSKIIDEVERKENRSSSLIKEANELGANILKKDSELQEMVEEFEEKSGNQYVEITRVIASLTSKNETVGMRLDLKDEGIKRNDDKIALLRSEISKNENELEDIDTNYNATKVEIAELETELSEKSSRYSKIIETLEDTSKKFFEYKGESEELEKEISGIRSEESRLGREIASLNERFTAKNDVLATLEKQIGEVDTEGLQENIGALDREREEMERALSDLDIKSLKDRENELINHREAIERKIKALNRNLTELQSKVGRKREQKDVYGRDLNAIDEILRLKESGEIRGIIGKFSDLGKTSKEYSVALEVAAGARMKNIVVEDSEVARKCVNHLKSRKMGRLTFLPLRDIKPYFDPNRFSSNLNREGAIDMAINLVEFKEEHTKAFEFVFSNTLIISDIDASKNMDRQRMVTLDGDVVESSGAITGGYWKPRNYLESFETKEDEDEIDSISHEIEEYEAKEESLRNELSDIRKKIEDSSQSETRLTTELNAAKRRLRELNEELGRRNGRLTNLTSQKDSVSELISSLDSDIKAKELELSSITSRLSSLNDKKADIDGKVEEYRSEGIEESQSLSEEISKLRGRREELLSALASMRSKCGSLRERNDSIADEIRDLEEGSAQLEQEKGPLESELEEIGRELEEKRQEENEISSLLSNIKSKRDSLHNELSEMRGRREKSQTDAAKLDSDVKVLEANMASLREKIAELEEEAKEYERPEEQADDLRELKFRISRMEKEKEGLEPINMRAIEEFDEVEDRYIMLSSKREKLIQEKNSILGFIDEIETKKKDVFMQAYDVVRKNFSEVFEQLSPDGEGNLVLEDDEDPFSGGLFIEARPAGKELNRTESMSGGEKALTALAFVFAIQKFKPAPFYILDEIDAHLDDENVRKVSELIKGSSGSSQFIVITHRDVMMTTADRLFGTSVSKDKISKIVSVELEKVSDVSDIERYGMVES